MSEGAVAEFDHPHILFQKEHSLLSQLAEHTGPSQRQALESIARASYLQRPSSNLGSDGSIRRRSASLIIEKESVGEVAKSKEKMFENEETQDESEDNEEDDDVFVS